MRIALLHSHYDEEHLEQVKAQMQELGAPVIKAVWMDCHQHWAALEGSHRIRAAHALGLEPEIDEVEYDEELTLWDVGCESEDDLSKCVGFCGMGTRGLAGYGQISRNHKM